MKSKVLITIILISMFALSYSAYSQSRKTQEFTSKSRKAKKSFKRAITFFDAKQYKDAIYEIQDALKYDSNFVEAYLMAGQIYSETNRNKKSLYYYRKASIVNPDFYPDVFITLSVMEMKLGMYKEALADMQVYDAHPNKNSRFQPTVDAGIERAEFGKWNMEHPVDYDPKNIGISVNSRNDEYVNTVNTEENRVIFTRKSPKNNRTREQRNAEEEDFYQSVRQYSNNDWNIARRMSSIFNTSGNEGAMNISPDQTKMVFTACYRNDGRGRCDIYISEKRGKTWSMPRNIGAPVNTGNWESNPCLSSDGKTLYFVRRKGRGNSDIYTAELLADGKFGNVKNLGEIINTDGSEMTPFIHADGRTLYFASNGHIGMGGMDLFMSRKDSNGMWGPVINLGYPINDFENQMGIIINAKGDMAYISSDMKEGFGGYDIYYFELYDDARPVQVNYMKGLVADKDSRKSLEANFKLYDLNTNTLIVESNSDARDGSFLVTIPNNAELGLYVSRKGYLDFSENFKVGKGHSSIKPFLKNVYLQKIDLNKKVILKNIFFASLSYELEPQSFIELEKINDFLALNSNVRIEIGGHTDNVGSNSENMTLSTKRANAVYEYLINNLKVDSKQITYKGYGENEPVTNNETEQGRMLNRRTEIKIIDIK
ncbi:MAG: PD40 domain-containing protein [Bacteroidales bacterium]|nr:PD40 domain-containing protein [Bacteroidales bacterium]